MVQRPGVCTLEVLGVLAAILLLAGCGAEISHRMAVTSASPTNTLPTTCTTASRPAGEPTKPPTSTAALTRTTPTSIPGTGTLSRDQVRLDTSKSMYGRGEQIEYVAVNDLERTIFYVGGCSWPIIQKVEGEDAVYMVTNRLESTPPVRELKPGENLRCSWDQEAWQDPDREGCSRFQHYVQLALVPSGHYRFAFCYSLDRSDARCNEKARMVYSQVFTIKDR